MMSNEQMRAGRFEKWAKCRAIFSAIKKHLAAGGRVQVSTHTRSTVYTAKHEGMFSCGKTGVYVQAGKQKVDIFYTSIRLIN